MFRGSFVALVTPFKHGLIDEPTLRRLVDRQILAGTDWLVPCGTTGESPTLSHEEHQRIVEIVIEQAAGRAKILAGTGSNNTAEAILLSKHALRSGADGILVITPYYNKPTQQGLILHFEAIARAADIPMVLYNVPGRTGVNMEPATVAALSKISTIQGLKEASGSLSLAAAIRNTCDITLLSGDDVLNYPLMAMGAQGVISVTANVHPEGIRTMVHAMLDGDFQEGRRLHEQLYALNTGLFVETNPIPVKAAMAMMGLLSEEYRLPLCAMTPSKREGLQTLLEQLSLLKPRSVAP